MDLSFIWETFGVHSRCHEAHVDLDSIPREAEQDLGSRLHPGGPAL